MDPSDRQLVEQARAGQRSALEALVRRYQKKVYAMALSMLRDGDRARDVAQDAFVKAFERIGDFQGESSFYTWIYRIAVNLCIDRLRREKRFSEVEFDETAEQPTDEALAIGPHRLGFDPARALHDKQIRERVLAALGELSAHHRAVIVLREMDGLSYKEIADVVGCSIGTVMSRLFHARRRMQDMLRPLVEDRDDEPVAKNAGVQG